MIPFLALRYRPGLMYCNWTNKEECGNRKAEGGMTKHGAGRIGQRYLNSELGSTRFWILEYGLLILSIAFFQEL
jgi:hypothetical protein